MTAGSLGVRGDRAPWEKGDVVTAPAVIGPI